MTPLPQANRQTYRQLQIPGFLGTSVISTSPSLGFNPELQEGGFNSSNAEPPVGYALELFSIYHPFLMAVKPEQETEALNNAAEVTIIARMTLTRRGILIWEGSPSVTVLRTGGKGVEKPILFVGQWGAQFQNPPVIQSPGELTLSTSVVIGYRTEQAAIKYLYSFGKLSHTEGPAEKWIGEYEGQGAIGYGLVKL